MIEFHRDEKHRSLIAGLNDRFAVAFPFKTHDHLFVDQVSTIVHGGNVGADCRTHPEMRVMCFGIKGQISAKRSIQFAWNIDPVILYIHGQKPVHEFGTTLRIQPITLKGISCLFSGKFWPKHLRGSDREGKRRTTG